jgi:hypothetical protein
MGDDDEGFDDEDFDIAAMWARWRQIEAEFLAYMYGDGYPEAAALLMHFDHAFDRLDEGVRYCAGPDCQRRVPADARADAKFCSTRCRVASHRRDHAPYVAGPPRPPRKRRKPRAKPS